MGKLTKLIRSPVRFLQDSRWMRRKPPEDVITAIRQLLSAHEIDTAERELRILLDHQPGHPEGDRLLLRAVAMQQRFPEADALLERIRAQAGEPQAVEAVGWYLLYAQRWTAAAAHWAEHRRAVMAEPRMMVYCLRTQLGLRDGRRAVLTFRHLLRMPLRDAQLNALGEVVEGTTELNGRLRHLLFAGCPAIGETQANLRRLQRRLARPSAFPAVSPYARPAAVPGDGFDLVYTWVDTEDPAWRARFAACNGRLPEAETDHHKNAKRYLNNWEILYSLHSFAIFAGGAVRNVHIITDGQRIPLELAPAALRDRIRHVDHRTIFGDAVQGPVFNSNLIELFLHNVPGLAEDFVYSNDDMFLGQPADRGTFFAPDGRGRSFLRPDDVRRRTGQMDPRSARVHPETWVMNAFTLFRDRFGFEPNLVNIHQVMPMKRSACRATWELFAEPLRRTFLGNRMRANTDVKTIALLNWVGLACGSMALCDHQRVQEESIFVNRALHDDIAATLLRVRPRFFCLNVEKDTQDVFWTLMDAYYGLALAPRLAELNRAKGAS